MYTNKKYILFLVVFLLSAVCLSQYKPPLMFGDGLSFTAKGGVNLFYGDLVDKSRNSYSFGVTMDREMHEFFTLRTQIMLGQMKGTQIQKDNPYVHFKNFYMEWTVGGTYNILNHAIGYYRERRFQPYALAHLGLVYYDAKEYWDETGFNQYIENDLWRTASGVAPILGLGGGTSIWISPRFKATAEFYGNFVFSDELDAHKDWYNLSQGIPGPIHETENKDFYYIATVGITYLLNDSRFRNNVTNNRRSYDRLRKYYNRKNQKSQAYRR